MKLLFAVLPFSMLMLGCVATSATAQTSQPAATPDKPATGQSVVEAAEAAYNNRSSLPMQEPFPAATQKLGKVELTLRANYLNKRGTTGVFVDEGPVREFTTLELHATRNDLFFMKPVLGRGFSGDDIDLGQHPVAEDVNIGSDPKWQEFVTSDLDSPNEYILDETEHYELTPKELEVSQIAFRLSVPGDSFDYFSNAGRYPELRRGIFATTIQSDLNLIYATHAGSLKYNRLGQDIDLRFPEPGLYWMHCYGGGQHKGDYTCRTGDLGGPAYLTLWKGKQ